MISLTHFCPSLHPLSMTALHSRLPPQPSRPSGKAAPLPSKNWTASLPCSLPPDHEPYVLLSTFSNSPCKDSTTASHTCSPVSIATHTPASPPADPPLSCSPSLNPPHSPPYPDPNDSQVSTSPAAAEKPPNKSQREGKSSFWCKY